MRDSSIAVIGAGNWGGSLIAALRVAGLGPLEVVRRDWRRPRLDARVIWICVPDAVSLRLRTRLRHDAGQKLRGQIVVHSSGALSTEVLEPARRRGRGLRRYSVMSFPTRKLVALEGVMFGIEARDAAVRRELSALVQRMGGVPFAVKAETKALYHAAGTCVSPLLVSAIMAAVETARLAGLVTRLRRSG